MPSGSQAAPTVTTGGAAGDPLQHVSSMMVHHDNSLSYVQPVSRSYHGGPLGRYVASFRGWGGSDK
jgi:hypothetical protein